MAKHSTKRPKRKTTYPLPYRDFPLSPHVATNRWYKVVHGHRHYFGRLDDPDGALNRWLDVKDYLEAGRTPPDFQQNGRLTLRDTCNRWLTSRLDDVTTGDLAHTTFDQYRRIAGLLLDILGPDTEARLLRPPDFKRLIVAIRRRHAPSQQSTFVTVIKMILRWAYENELLEAPLRTGTEFKVAARSKMRAEAANKGRLIYTAEEVQRLIATADVHLAAMIWLGINGGYAQSDVARLTFDDVDLDGAIVDHVRHKWGIVRTVPLWPETVAAIRASLDERPAPKVDEAKDLIFVTRFGLPWVRAKLRDDGKLGRTDAVNLQFSKLTRGLKIEINGAGFGKLRHTHRTASDGANDAHAAMRIMGHEIPGISSHYVKGLDLARLQRVADYVHTWLFAKAEPVRKPRKRSDIR